MNRREACERRQTPACKQTVPTPPGTQLQGAKILSHHTPGGLKPHIAVASRLAARCVSYNCIAPSLQESAEDDAVVMAQLADVVNKLQPADSWRAPVTAADVASVSIEEMTARMKVPSSRKQWNTWTPHRHSKSSVPGPRLQGF